MADYTSGSQWRRWDLHVHTPGTALNDQFGDWEEYLTAIASQSDVKVVGITDYLSISNYSRMKEFKDEGRLDNIDLLIPNIEFRIAPPSERATAINIHLLVSPDDPEHEQKILAALARLDWQFKGNRYSCLPDQLMALGRAFDRTVSHDNIALRTGVTQFKVDFSRFREWYDSEPWLRRNSLVAVAAGADGLSGFRRDGAWAAHREEITRFSHILFSGRPGEREFWLCHGSEQDKETAIQLGGPKPCLHGSDAHSIASLFLPDENRFCWIKADPTFEGLKQVLYEPESRVCIGPSAPLFHDEARVIRSIKFSNSNGWFDDVEIPLNPGLVSIIGQKGSGKSALAEVTAYTAGGWNTNEAGSFLSRAGVHLKDVMIELYWADDNGSSAILGEEQSDDASVRYLSQKFVERLCAEDQIGSELIQEIEAVIFSHLDPTDTLSASSFDELRFLRTEGIRAEGDRLRDEIMRLTREECSLRDNFSKLPEKKARIKGLTEEYKGLTKQLPKAASAQEEKIQTELQNKRLALTAAQNASGLEKHRLQRLSDIRLQVEVFRSQMRQFSSAIDKSLSEVGIDAAADRARFHPILPADTEPPLAAKENEIKESLANRQGAAENPAEGTINWFQREIARLSSEASADKARQDKIKNIQTRMALITVELEKLTAEIARLEGPERERLGAVRRERLDAYTGFFRNLQQEQRSLEELYAPVSARLTHESTSRQEQALEFSIRWEADLRTWLERGSSLFDQRTTIPYGTMQELGKAARRILAPAWTSGDPDLIEPALETFRTPFRNRDLPASKYLRSGVSLQHLLEWLYDVDHIRLTYGLKYNAVELENLSPGTKGIVLLILYLGMDTHDTRPLIVDQPDENLDNESVYELLTAYFKLAKTRRQILLITHNPNLVVNADSEQVIVATCGRRQGGLPHISYKAGALEDSHVREQVCRILEGGSDAFRKRERRYSLSEG